MSKFAKLFLTRFLAGVLIFSSFSPSAMAYESDTHLRMTYLLLRTVG